MTPPHWVVNWFVIVLLYFIFICISKIEPTTLTYNPGSALIVMQISNGYYARHMGVCMYII